MKAYVLNSVGQLDYMDVPKPTLNNGEVLVEVKAAGICGSDIPRIFVNGTYHFPTIPGHEFSGKVVEAYDEVLKSRWLGKRVGVFPLIPCMECTSCKNRQYEMCSNYYYLGSRCDGGFAEYVAVPSRNLIELPDEISYEAAAMLEPAAVGVHALRRLNDCDIKTAVIFGPGTIGLLMAQWLRVFGVEDITLVGTNVGQQKMTEKLGFTKFVNRNDYPNLDVEEVDLAIECTGYSNVLSDCINAAKRGGNVLIVGNPHGNVEIDRDIYWKILRKQLTLAGTWNSSFIPEIESDDWVMAIEAIKSGKLNPELQITHKLEFGELHKGLEIMKDKTEYYNKVMVVR